MEPVFNKGVIKKIQIQTIDNCNFSCFMCPNGYKEKTKKNMEDWVFKKIIQESIPYFSNHVQICLFLENEPLLDNKLFKRIEYLKKSIPNNYDVHIVTNGFLSEKYKDDIIKYVDIFHQSLYGENAEEFSKITGINITEEKYHKMVNINKEIASKTKLGRVELKIVKAIEKNFFQQKMDEKRIYSRGGFLNNQKILTNEEYLRCPKNEPFEFFNFLADGSFILCCMDYTKETAMGNIKEQSLSSILSSEKAQRIINQARGLERADENFICRRCEKH